MKTLLLLPNQLFYKHKFDFDFDQIILYEHPKFFTLYNYHKAKLVFHRSTMKSYYDFLIKKYNKKVIYVNFDQQLKLTGDIIIYEPTDFYILKEVKNICKKKKLNLTINNTQLFILNLDEIYEYLNTNKNLNKSKLYFNATFYKWIRIKKNILLEEKTNKPLGGQWSFDKDNREKFIKSYTQDKIHLYDNNYIKEARIYVEKHFKKNIGETNIFVPITHSEAKKYYKKFLKEKLSNFGTYEDAFSSKVIIGYHSGISALLNIGLLNPNEIINDAISYSEIYSKKKSKKIKIESLEGFIRQVLSWREYTRMLYIKEHTKFIKMNFFKHHNKLNKSWYDATTGILPIDNIIKKVLRISYAHHIERLMVIGNFMLLLQINPKYIYKWFIEVISIDAYEWVMEPNVYGMSQHSVGQLMMSRPYFSSSNYLLKMSNYTKSDIKDNEDKIKINNNFYTWYEIWDALYYNFINKHKIYLKSNYATANSVYILNKKSEKDKEILFKIAKSYMKMY